jgi:hypothetical protein
VAVGAIRFGEILQYMSDWRHLMRNSSQKSLASKYCFLLSVSELDTFGLIKVILHLFISLMSGPVRIKTDYHTRVISRFREHPVEGYTGQTFFSLVFRA